MTIVMLPQDVHNAILNISFQLEKANELREEELELMKLYMDKIKGISL